MKWTGIAFALSALEVSAIHVVERDTSGRAPKVVRNQIRRHEVANPVERDRSRFTKRQNGVLDIPLTNNISLYYLDITIGTPPQYFRVNIDTGSSDLWVNSQDSDICSSSYGDDQCTSGTYDSSSSDTYEEVNNDFSIQYVDGRTASGSYVRDTVGLGDNVNLTQQQFGVVDNSEITVGIMGIGYRENVAQESLDNEGSYDNIPITLQNSGYINSLTYSIWLNDLDSSEGELLFGGVNRDKYIDDLTTVPVQSYYGEYSQLAVNVDGIAISGQSVFGSRAEMTAILDTGASLSYLPPSIASVLFDTVGATEDPYGSGLAIVDCSIADYSDTLDFTFDSKTISVPMNELVIRLSNFEGNSSTTDSSSFDDIYDQCVFGIASGTVNGISILGDTFLRSAYVVYDLTNNEISLAQTNFNSTTDDIVEIGSNGSVSGVGTGGGVTTASSQLPTSGPTLTVATTVQTVIATPTVTQTDAAPAIRPVAVSLLGALAALLML